MNSPAEGPALDVRDVSYRYGSRQALNNIGFDVRTGEIFALLGPNGGGKSTLFRLIATLMPLQAGEVAIFGCRLRTAVHPARRHIGVVFQAPSLDRKLTVLENMQHQAALYGLGRRAVRPRIDALLEQVGVADRRNEFVESLSGGLRRRVELAKGMLHEPRLLLMDEPSTGLDPGARGEFWNYVERIRAERQMTVVLTTHLMDEAERADRIAILDQGRLVALGAPAALRAELGGDTLTIETDHPEQLAEDIERQFAIGTRVLPGIVRLELPHGSQWVVRLVEAFPERIRSITLGKPTLEDVFIARTGRGFMAEEGDARGE